MKESEIQKQIIDYLKVLPQCLPIRFHSSGVPGKGRRKAYNKGVSDILVCYKGRFVALEVKTKSGKLSEGQKQFKIDLNDAGGLFFKVTSVEEVEQIFKGIK